MNRWFILIACVVIFAGCKKTTVDDVTSSSAINAQALVDDARLVSYLQANSIDAVHVGSPKSDTVGVYYVIEDAGTTTALYTTSTTITVSFTAKYIVNNTTETQFTATNDYNPSFILGDVIKGWRLALLAAKINKGGKIRILMSSRYAYGPYAQTQYGLPANSILDFEINIIDVIN